MLRFIVNAIFILISCVNLYGQSVESLRKERENIIEEIIKLQKLLNEKIETKDAFMQKLSLLDREIFSRRKLINNFEREINKLDEQIEVNELLINDLEKDIQSLKEEYAQLIRYTYRQRGELNQLMFLFSAESFSNLYTRFRLFKEYSNYRKTQGEKLVKSQNQVKGLLKEIQVQKNEKQAVLNEIEIELARLEENRKNRALLIKKLQEEQKWLQQNLKQKEVAAQQLEKKIKELIAAEKALSINKDESITFEDMKGQLVWPVENGVIVNPFGEHAHPILKNVSIKNNGIDIQTLESSDVRCVHSGVVSMVVAIPGLNKTVIVRHGKYLTVYGNLIEVVVKKGDIVEAGEILGKIYHGNTNMNKVLHFEVWEENNKLDPALWLKP